MLAIHVELGGRLVIAQRKISLGDGMHYERHAKLRLPKHKLKRLK